MSRRSNSTSRATIALLERERFRGEIFEPLRADEGIVVGANKKGFAVFTTSLGLLGYDRYDITNIITEPTTNNITELVRKALDVALRKVAFLMPLEVMATNEMQSLSAVTPLARVYMIEKHLIHRPRVMAWYIWERGWCEPPVFRWI